MSPAPPRRILLLGGEDERDIRARLDSLISAARAGDVPPSAVPGREPATAPVRLAVDYGHAADLAGKLSRLAVALDSGLPMALHLLRQQGVYLVRGPAAAVAFLYPGQGSQYPNMLRGLAAREPVVRATFDEADRVMTPILGRTLTSYMFADDIPPAGDDFNRIEIAQPAVLACDVALTRLLAQYGFGPDAVMGHSFGEYAALVVAGSMRFDEALELATCHGVPIVDASTNDNGAMAAVCGSAQFVQRVIDDHARGFVAVANINSTSQVVIGGGTEAVTRLVERFEAADVKCFRVPVSHAFHTPFVANASAPVMAWLHRMAVVPPRMPVVANLNGEFYPKDSTVESMIEGLGRQLASPVQFVKGLHALYDAGVRVFVEVGPKKALYSFVEDVLGRRHQDVLALFTNHPKLSDEEALNRAVCGMSAAGPGLRGNALGYRETTTSIEDLVRP